MVEQSLVRHSGIASRIVARDASFISPEDMGVLPGDQLTEGILGQMFIGTSRGAPPGESDGEPAAGLHGRPRLSGEKLGRSVAQSLRIIINADYMFVFHIILSLSRLMPAVPIP